MIIGINLVTLSDALSQKEREEFEKKFGKEWIPYNGSGKVDTK